VCGYLLSEGCDSWPPLCLRVGRAGESIPVETEYSNYTSAKSF